MPEVEIQMHYRDRAGARSPPISAAACCASSPATSTPPRGFTAQWLLVVNARSRMRAPRRPNSASPSASRTTTISPADSRAQYRAGPGRRRAQLQSAVRRLGARPAWRGPGRRRAPAGAADAPTPPSPITSACPAKYQPGLANYASAAPWCQAVPIDEGFIDYAAFLRALHAGGFRGSVRMRCALPCAAAAAWRISTFTRANSSPSWRRLRAESLLPRA